MKYFNSLLRLAMRIVAGGIIGFLIPVHAYALDIPATLHWSKRVELSTPVSGIIKSIEVDTGDKVEKNATLIKLDDRNYIAEVKKARARVKSLDEKRKEAKREFDRARELYDRTVLSDHDLQTAKNAKTAADSDYETAKAELTTAELNLEYTDIRAPFKAYVLKRNVEPGQTVVSQLKPEPLITLAAAGEMIARGYIEQSELDGQHRNQPATVLVAGQTFQAKVKHIGLEPVKTDKQGIYYEIDVVFDTGERVLRAGQQAMIKLP